MLELEVIPEHGLLSDNIEFILGNIFFQQIVWLLFKYDMSVRTYIQATVVDISGELLWLKLMN